jgi:predicted DNA-binding transcriptional regulator AlpA
MQDSNPSRMGGRWLSQAQALEHCSLTRSSFRRHVLPHLHPSKVGTRIVRYDRHEIDRVLAAGGGQAAPSQLGEEAAWLAKLDEDSGARR